MPGLEELEVSKAQEAVVCPHVKSGLRDCEGKSELVPSPLKPTPHHWIYKHNTGTRKAVQAPHDSREEQQTN